VAHAPHYFDRSLTTRRMMLDVLIALLPVIGMSLWVFGPRVLFQIALSVAGCLAAEALFTSLRKRRPALNDLSAAVTGVILALSFPSSVPVHVNLIACFAAIGLGKIVFGGLGQNIFNPAMVGRAFVMIAFPAALGASAYIQQGSEIAAISQATPLSAAKQMGNAAALWPLFIGNVNGSLGETSALACLLGGLYLCLRRTASFEIPVGILGAVIVLGGIQNLVHPDTSFTLLHHLFAGSLLFGTFFIATDPVTSPLTPLGKILFGAGIGILVMVIRVFSGYPEGVMFAVLLMNAAAPLLNRWTIPKPVGGPVPGKQQ
jgi:electron transport complex protein RnfD